jgi:hypothetical protein
MPDAIRLPERVSKIFLRITTVVNSVTFDSSSVKCQSPLWSKRKLSCIRLCHDRETSCSIINRLTHRPCLRKKWVNWFSEVKCVDLRAFQWGSELCSVRLSKTPNTGDWSGRWPHRSDGTEIGRPPTSLHQSPSSPTHLAPSIILLSHPNPSTIISFSHRNRSTTHWDLADEFSLQMQMW